MSRLRIFFYLLLLFPTLSWASAGYISPISVGHLVWLLMASILVIFMTVPGIALFYGGLSQKKHALSLVAQCFILGSIVSLLWVAIGYSLTFGSAAPFIGNLQELLLNHIPLFAHVEAGNRVVFVLFQMGFAMLTVAIITGGIVGRMRLGPLIIFIILWSIFAYYPIAHWFWGYGWIENLGVLDYAGGAVVHINAGIASLVAAIMLGKGETFSKQKLPAHNTMLVVLGTAILWVGWFGFNAGSSLHFSHAPTVSLITQIAACSGLLTWTTLAWLLNGKASVTDVCSGALAGLVAITPAAGYVGIGGAFGIGFLSCLACFFLIRMKYLLHYDDTLDAFGIHGISGITGSLLTALFYSPLLGGRASADYSIGHQFLMQLFGTVTAIVWSGLVSFLILRGIKCVSKLRVDPEKEQIGLDYAHFGETQETQGG